jgi:hypothetical protein
MHRRAIYNKARYLPERTKLLQEWAESALKQQASVSRVA